MQRAAAWYGDIYQELAPARELFDQASSLPPAQRLDAARNQILLPLRQLRPHLLLCDGDLLYRAPCP